ncbi:DUF3313 domain-containing protein [Agrobacterium genomosp. 13]|uniref:DUF3313 domain-containing protein n=1 Tax=Agrobacterium genomosp. 13 str. CFBP 6927 TaxID=1183428 RepID=A0ABM9VJB4_9HYPH|nr:DUF3313 domain-containing protein [Agrobacterium genomosp. 13]CUX47283.1 conserved hypothetical protein; putative exported protein [Agrobacterium genomosp. 13 str. CFBP 6927]
MSNSRSVTASGKPPYVFMGRTFLPILAVSFVTSCASVPIEQANTLASYDGLTSADGLARKTKFKASARELATVRTIYVEPTVVSPGAALSTRNASDRALVANAISRSLCVGVSDRFQVVDTKEDADLVVHATVTRIVPTNPTVAGLSTATSLGASFVVPVPVPRIPMGLGGLSVEAEATTSDGRQLGAMVWAKGANALTTSPRASQIGDAYSLASSFGNDFSKMLVTGKTPFKGLPKLPSSQKLKSGLGGKPKYHGCEKFGRAPGLKDFAASQVGLPPSWTDKAER